MTYASEELIAREALRKQLLAHSESLRVAAESLVLHEHGSASTSLILLSQQATVERLLMHTMALGKTRRR